MQKAPQATFKGQVKRGGDNNWKRGRVEFFVEADAGSWTVQFYHDVNPGRVVHRYKSLLGKSASIVFKCNRLIIGDKSEGESHIKIPEHEADNAQKLVKKITSYNMGTPCRNRAEVGVASSQNGYSSSNGKMSSKVSTLPWLSKTTPPPSMQQEPSRTTSSAKRKIELGTSDKHNGLGGESDMDCFELDEDDDVVSFPRFTGMKDYSKSQRTSSSAISGKGLGPINFYGADKSLMSENAYSGLNRKPASSPSPSNQSDQRSPKVKRAKLSDLGDIDRENKLSVSTSSKALLKGALSNRMAGRIPTLSDPQENSIRGEREQNTSHLDSSGHHSDGQMVGFDNLGNTCFMNSPLQCISALEPLSLDIQSSVYKFNQQLSPDSVTKMLYMLMKDVRRPTVRPEQVKEILSRIRSDINSNFASDTQQDALELVTVLLDRTDNELTPLLRESVADEDAKNKEMVKSKSTSSSPPTSDGENEEATDNSNKSRGDKSTEDEENKEPSDDSKKPESTKSTQDETFQLLPTWVNFGWVSRQTIFFHECKTKSVLTERQNEKYLMVPLVSGPNVNVQDCIDKDFANDKYDYECPTCKKMERATIFTKIVKRPRCFIMTLLRYESESTHYRKKHDTIDIPRHISVMEFCVEDVKPAAPIEPIFLLERSNYDANLPSESAKMTDQAATPAVKTVRSGHVSTTTSTEEDKQKVAESEPEYHSSLGRTVARALESCSSLKSEDKGRRDVQDGETEIKEEELDPEVLQRLRIKRMANHLADQFAEVEQHIEMAREAAEDFTEIYTQAQCLIIRTNELAEGIIEQGYEFESGETKESDSYKMMEQKTLCDVLVQQALIGDDEPDDEFDFSRVRRKLILLRYRNVLGEAAKLNHLINDLAMYLAAKEVGIVVDPDSPKDSKKILGNKGKTQSDHDYECDERGEKSGLGRGEGDGECDSREVFMEEDSGNRGSIEVNPSMSWGQEEMENWDGIGVQDSQKGTEIWGENNNSTSVSRRVGRCEVNGQASSERTSWDKVERTEESSSGAMADVSNNATINTTCDRGFLEDDVNQSVPDDPDPIFLGRPVSEWSEVELYDVEVNALGEEDVMIYALALSRFEYEREQINHSVAVASTTAAKVDVSLPDPFTVDDCVDSNDTAISYDDTSTSSAQARAGSNNASQELFEQSEEKCSGEVNSTSKSSISVASDNDKEEALSYSPVSERDPIVKLKATKEEQQSSQSMPDLQCEETLSDLDEPDGSIEDSPSVKVKGLKGGQRGITSGARRNRSLSSEKSDKPSEHVTVKDNKTSTSPSLSLTDKSKVLSPHKGLTNHENSLSSNSCSSLSDAQTSSNGNRSPRLHLSPTVSPVPTTTSCVSGNKKSEVNLNNTRDIHMLSPSTTHVSPRRENYSVSQSKTARNELARLRSPSSASPRKRMHKESGSASHRCNKTKAGSASKRLLFEDNKNSNRAESLVKRALVTEDTGKGLKDNLSKNFPIQEDLIQNGSLAKSDEGELSDPDDIKLLSPRKSARPKILSPVVSQPKAMGDNQGIGLASSNPSPIPQPVPIGTSRHSNVKTIKTEPSPKPQSTQVLSPSPLKSEESNQQPSKQLKSIPESTGDENVPNLELLLDEEKMEPMGASSKSKENKPQLSVNEEKENVVESATRKERMDNIEMGKADCSYRLVGIVNHHGESLNAGHYTAYSFNFNKQRWYHMDDKNTKATTESTARTESTNTGYVFFYMDKELFDGYSKRASERQQNKI